MTYIIRTYECSKCGKHSTSDTYGWVILQEQYPNSENTFYSNGEYVLYPKCRADILGPLTKTVVETKTTYEKVPGWTYQNADELTWEPKYDEDTPIIKISSEDVFVTGLTVDGYEAPMPATTSWARVE